MRWWTEVDEAELEWLIDSCGKEVAGFGPPPYPAGLWILHAMYEFEDRSESALAADEQAPEDEPGWSVDPGKGWRRLRWHELAERTGDPVVAQHVEPQYRVPSFRAFSSIERGDGLWESIRWPDVGSMDRQSFSRLAAVLRRYSGSDTVTFAHPCFLRDTSSDSFRVYRGLLKDLEKLEKLDPYYSPANIWPTDRSWLVYTSWDLSGTKIYGPPELLRMIEQDEFLESLRLPLPDAIPDYMV